MYYYVQLDKRNRPFLYQYDKEIEPGTYCEVSFQKSIKKGVVVEKLENVNVSYSIKNILNVFDEKLDDNLFKLICWINSYYIEPFGSLVPLIEKPKTGKVVQLKQKKTSINDVEIVLNENQQKVFDDIVNSKKNIHLIHGITGSGKTYVYIQLIKKALSENKGVIFLVPEIALTTQFLSKLQSIFGDKLALWHSKLTANEKMTYYENLENGNIKIVLGTRSAIFSNVKNLGYIIVDEEHESTYKQQETPRYHLKNVAIKRAIIENAKVVFGSATPSFETYYQAKKNDIQIHSLQSRFNKSTLPEFEIIDLNTQKDYLSDRLLYYINDRLNKNEQVILLLNRKAYSIMVKCQDCNEIIQCLDCSYKLTYSKTRDILKCNQCDRTYKMVSKCKCGSDKLIKFGIGTETVEEKLKELFDDNIILRMDSDSMNTNKKIEKAYNSFINKEYMILVGTQILAKGFHFPDVTLVGIINADQMLNTVDFRTQEKTFALITQAAGRAGRAEKKGLVVLQTYNKESDLINAIQNNDYDMIYNSQMIYRKALGLPPYSKQIKILIDSLKEEKLDKIAIDIYNKLEKNLYNIANVSMPVRAGVYKISNRYRKYINIIYKRQNEKNVKNIIRQHTTELNIGSSRVLVDVDPLDMF